MDERLLGLCSHAFEAAVERHVDELFEAAGRLPGADDFRTTTLLKIPYIEDPGFFAGFEPAGLRQTVVRALCARERFNRESPDWTPDLPLHETAIAKLENSDDTRMNLVGLFADSLRGAYWSEQHPSFDGYCRGVMACENTPIEILGDPELQSEFPPRPLPGLCDGRLAWRSLKKLTWDRKMQRMIAAYEAGIDPRSLPWLSQANKQPAPCG